MVEEAQARGRHLLPGRIVQAMKVGHTALNCGGRVLGGEGKSTRRGEGHCNREKDGTTGGIDAAGRI
jgi:hypothetical protein